MSNVSPDNEAQQNDWNEPGETAWTRWQARMDIQLAPLGLAVIEAVAPRHGERVLDIGCGCGDTTLQVDTLVGPSGTATGVDISAPMLDRARDRAAESGLENTRFLEGDAQVATARDLGGPFEAAISRFGVMFFADPIAAFANIASLVHPGEAASASCAGRRQRSIRGCRPWSRSGDPVPGAATARPACSGALCVRRSGSHARHRAFGWMGQRFR